MRKNQDKWIVAFISITILITISAQVYLLVKHYETSKHLLYKQIHFSLNKAVDNYYEDIAKGGIISLTSEDANNPNKTKTDTLRIKDRFSESTKSIIDSTLNIISQKDSSKTYLLTPAGMNKNGFKKLHKWKRNIPKHIDKLISKVYISFSRDSLKLDKLNILVQKELDKHDMKLEYALSFTKKNRSGEKVTTKTKNFQDLQKNHIRIKSNPSYFPHRNGKLVLHYTDENSIILKRSLFEILLSFLLSASIISCLLYLLYTINKQKKIAAIKNDFISNITHEFKTPIATISAALEGIKNFNKLNDTDKTEKYIDMSTEQVTKLNTMVEKLLETATLHSGKLSIDKKNTNLQELLESISNKHQIISSEAKFTCKSNKKDIYTPIDVFHFENAIDNILDNAIKYGGSSISTKLSDNNDSVVIEISDNGVGMKKKESLKIFDQFYRVQKGNIHDTKGFGIGLYYTKKIIEKHNGEIYVDLEKKDQTTFIIKLPK
jgi:two-component system phosphate regulon sensor histidine kinase PhoR